MISPTDTAALIESAPMHGVDQATVFREWMLLVLRHGVSGTGTKPRPDLERVLEGIADLLRAHAPPWKKVPDIIRGAMEGRGWAWNGIYVRRGERLELFCAAGPPVCHVLERRGGPGTSGMCWDALLMNQTVSAADVKAWPGYVSCDGESGLQTRAGLVCPIRGAGGRPLAVWDLDATLPLEAAETAFCDALFATLSVLLEPEPSVFD